jgi:glycosyltransferase involved in cell wall biosynthesis
VALGVLCGATGGPAAYGRHLAAALAARDDVELTVITDRGAAFAALPARVVEVAMRGGVDRLRWQHVALLRTLRTLRPNVYHDTKNALPLRCPVPAVVTVHDLAYFRCPETFGPASRMFLRWSTTHAIRRARLVLTPSHATAEDVRSIYPRARARVRVVPHGIVPWVGTDETTRQEVLRRHGLQSPFVLHVGTIQRRKNVGLLVRAVRGLRAAGLPHQLVLAGRRGWLADETFAEIEADREAVRWLGEVSDADLTALYDAAAAFASPSEYEGFGFTVADALAAGLPCAISNVSSLPEVCGDAALHIEELTVDGVVRALRRLLGDPALARQLAEAGPRRAAEYTWSAAAAATRAAYAEALSSIRATR